MKLCIAARCRRKPLTLCVLPSVLTAQVLNCGGLKSLPAVLLDKVRNNFLHRVRRLYSAAPARIRGLSADERSLGIFETEDGAVAAVMQLVTTTDVFETSL